MSVSPRLAGDREAPDIVVAPRVADRQAFEEMAGALRRLIDEAGVAREALERIVQETRQGDERAGRASVLLQERLRLGAQMLKALDTQIESVEHEAERVDRFEERLSRAAETAVARISESAVSPPAPADTDRVSIATLLRELADRLDEE